jgi:hypothetical protein
VSSENRGARIRPAVDGSRSRLNPDTGSGRSLAPRRRMRGEPGVGQPFIEPIGGSGRETMEDVAEVREEIDVVVPAGPVWEQKTAAVRPPRSFAGFRPFFRPTATGRIAFSTGLSSIGS